MNQLFSVLAMVGSLAANAGEPEIVVVDVLKEFTFAVSFRSDETQVCKMLGYAGAVEGSGVPVTETKTIKPRQNRWDFGGTMGARTVEYAPRVLTIQIVDAETKQLREVTSRQLSQLKCVK